MTKRCIVCGKPIAKATHVFYVKPPEEARPEQQFGAFGGTIPAREARPEGFVDRTRRWATTVYTSRPPQTREECARFTNLQVIRHKNGAPGQGIVEFTVWDGESYRDPHFHSETCAAAQGRASAHSGDRYKWRKT